MNSRRLQFGTLILAGCTRFLGVSPPDEPRPPAAAAREAARPSFEKDVVPFLAKHCYSCHGGGKNRGDLTLDKYQDEQAIVKDREVWENVVEMVRTGEMPPKAKGRPRPTPAEVELATRAIDDLLDRFDCTGPRNDGRVTIRRLNRAEYNNTIRDLVGVDFKPAADFPNDDVGYGFDNIGDVLSLSPLLLEKYLAAAEAILDQAIVIADPPKPSKERLEQPPRVVRGRRQPTGWRPLPAWQGADLRADLPRRGRLHDPGRGLRPASRRRAGARGLAGRRGRCSRNSS